MLKEDEKVFLIKIERNKEFLETNYPRGSPDSYQDIEVFR